MLNIWWNLLNACLNFRFRKNISGNQQLFNKFQQLFSRLFIAFCLIFSNCSAMLVQQAFVQQLLFIKFCSTNFVQQILFSKFCSANLSNYSAKFNNLSPTYYIEFSKWWSKFSIKKLTNSANIRQISQVSATCSATCQQLVNWFVADIQHFVSTVSAMFN